MKKLCFILCMCLLLTGCGSASSDYGYKDDLSDVIVKDYDDSDPTSFPDPAPDMEKDIFVYYRKGEFKDYKEFGQDDQKRYYMDLHMYNDRALDAEGNWDFYYDDDYNSERSLELLEGALEDFEQYCKEHDIPYVIYEYENRWAWLDLCISPEQFFAYDFLPQVSYHINFVIDDTHEKFDEFLGHVKKGERTAEPSLARQGCSNQDLRELVILVEDFDKELNRAALSFDGEEDVTDLDREDNLYSVRSFDGEEKNVRGVFTNYEEFGVSADDQKQYFVNLGINNDWVLDEDGNLSYVTEPDPEMFKDALEDFEQYCKDHDIPYVIYKYGKYSAWMYLCISPEQFFAYDFLPQVSYDIRFVIFQQRFDKFLRHIQKGEIRLYELERYKKK